MCVLTLQDDRPNHPKDNQEDDGIAGESADWVIEILHRDILYLIEWLGEPRCTFSSISMDLSASMLTFVIYLGYIVRHALVVD